MESGIYKIVNIKNNKFYVGSSKNLMNRWKEHSYSLRKNKHINCILQRAWNKYGEQSFNFEIIESCSPYLLYEREQFYLDLLKPPYNIGVNATGGDNLTNNPNRKDIIQKIVIGLYHRYEKMTENEKKEKSDNLKGEKNPNFGNAWTEDMKKIASLRTIEYFKNNQHYKKGKIHNEIFGEEKAKEISDKISEFASTRIGEKNPFYGKHHSEETKKNSSVRRKDKYYGEQNIHFLIDDKEYKSLGDASKELNIPITTIRWRIKSKNKKFNNYRYKE
jgi:group I intron endonuclease